MCGRVCDRLCAPPPLSFALKVGEMSEIVDTDSGVHIILRTK